MRMFRRNVAESEGRDLLLEVRPGLQRCSRRPGPGFDPEKLKKFRDRLRRSVNLFSEHHADYLHEDIYQPVADALAHVTYALTKSPIHEGSVHAALECLHELGRVLEPATDVGAVSFGGGS